MRMNTMNGLRALVRWMGRVLDARLRMDALYGLRTR
jgi:hypothetical protein